MRCVNCRKNAGYNRAVIELFSGVEIGGLCMNCERDEFGRHFDSSTDADRCCSLCNRDGQVQFPRYVPETHVRDGDLVVESSIETGDAVPCLCDEHFHELLEEPSRPRSLKL